MLRKNVASQVVGAQMVSATDGSAFTGSVTCSVTGDGGTQAPGSVGSGACTHEGNGFHTYAPAQAETNYNHVAFTFTGTGAIPVTVQVYTASFNPTDTVRLGLTALPNAAAEASGGLYTRGTGAGQIDQPANGTINVRTTHIGGTSQTGRDLGASVLLSPGTGTGQISLSSGAVTVGTNNDKTGYGLADGAITSAKFAAGAITASVIATDAIDADALASDAIAEINATVDTAISDAALATASALSTVDGNVDAIKAVTDVLPDAGALTSIASDATDAKTAAEATEAYFDALTEDDGGTPRYTSNALEQGPGGGSAPTASEIADAVWDEDLTEHTTTDSAGDILGNVATGTPPSAATIADAVWDEARADHVSAGTFGQGLASVQGNVTGSVGSVTGNVGGNVTGSIGSLATQAKADVNAEVDAALADYDAPTKAELDSAVSPLATSAELAKVPKSDGTATWNATAAAQIQSEAADALTAYDPPTRAEATSDANSILAAVGDVPTNAELATALASADDAVLAAIAALHNLSAAAVNAEVDQAIADAALATASALSTAQSDLTAIKNKTDSLTFTQTGQVDANVQRINDVPIVGDGSGTPFGV
jgi:hypothetical protein